MELHGLNSLSQNYYALGTWKEDEQLDTQLKRLIRESDFEDLLKFHGTTRTSKAHKSARISYVFP